MRRLYYLTRSMDYAETISNEIHDKGITDWNFHIMSRDKKGLTKHHLHSTNTLIHERDVIRIGERGAIVGVSAGFFATISFLTLTTFIPVRNLSQATMLFVCISFGVIGATLGSLLGLALENAKIRRFHEEMENGKHLLMIDVRKNDAPKMEEMMSAYKEAEPAGDGTSFISPFQRPRRA
jgi:hypothetical protein